MHKNKKKGGEFHPSGLTSTQRTSEYSILEQTKPLKDEVRNKYLELITYIKNRPREFKPETDVGFLSILRFGKSNFEMNLEKFTEETSKTVQEKRENISNLINRIAALEKKTVEQVKKELNLQNEQSGGKNKKVKKVKK
jgi:hypothetical protein